MQKKSLFTDPFGSVYFLKRILIAFLGFLSFRRFRGFNKMSVEGVEHLEGLPETNVLFVSNHQTYFADVFGIYFPICALKNGYVNRVPHPFIFLNPVLNLYFIGADETLKESFLSKLLAYAGTISVKRTWRAKGKDIKREVDFKEINNIEIALNHGKVVTFPQGTTTPFAPGRKGTAHIIKDYNPIVVPIVIDGFRKVFDKKGLKVIKKGEEFSVRFKAPLTFEKDQSIESMVETIMDAIEQSDKYNPELQS
ncbi:MAG: 1-acyl-sn-glycerol-3-phosphate acyltransferase [Flavobacteriaceae bacterium]|nr:MAG: 1-acyl-sn-glycerol-3-phosphate acyltransferase [Flavobacteriaceae bacterium]